MGGGCPEKELSDIVLEWMVQHSVKHGLQIFMTREACCTPNPRIRPEPKGGPAHA